MGPGPVRWAPHPHIRQRLLREQPRNETVLDVQGAQTQDGNTVVAVIVVDLQSVHGPGQVDAQGKGHRHTEGYDENPPFPPQLLPQQDPGSHKNEHALQDDVAGEVTTESPRDRERERQWSRARQTLCGVEGGARTGDDGHGSRTFFIHVIARYYPPNRQLVIDTDPLYSFQELAELPGQVKHQ
ncbi:hypothetical protein EI94DRAFT_1813039 [Lactarius quietus]|nr:hypothetical protein EI94DRAFT_1813039 [Lactarius quietus]